jgi:exodeoxyribonuclease VII large subunit
MEIFSVSELTSRIKYLIGSKFRGVSVEGEVSNAKLYPSGHLYFTLKDDSAMIRAVAFNYRDKFPGTMVLKDGDAIVCQGRVDVYEKRGEYQLIVDGVRIKIDQGLLFRKFLELKEKLAKEGLFDVGKKKAIPFLPERIGIVTSPAGAAIRDMLKIIFGKFENMAVLIYPVKVQGEKAAPEIAEGIAYFNLAKEVDVIIIGRGGGSLEDLAPFNEEVVARAIDASEIPVVSGAGHEIDFTISDFAADLRAPTPTAAADMVVPDKAALIDGLEAMKERLHHAMHKKVESARMALYENVAELKERRDFIISYRMYIDELLNNLVHGFSVYFTERKGRVESLAQRLLDLNPDNILKRGFSVTMKKSTGEVVSASEQVTPGDDLTIRLHKGELEVKVEEANP